VSKTILVGEPQILGEANALAELTGSFEDAVGEMKGLGEEAIATGRSLGEMKQLGEVAAQRDGVAGDTSEAIGKIRAQADDVAPSVALRIRAADREHGRRARPLRRQTDESRSRLTALMAVLGKGLAPGAGARVQSQVLSSIEGSALDINRTLGRDILDDEAR